MDDANSEDANSETPDFSSSDHLTLCQKLQVDAASQVNNENEEEDDIESILEKLRQEKSSSKLSGPELHSPTMVNLTKPSKPVWSDVAHTSHRWVYDLAEKVRDTGVMYLVYLTGTDPRVRALMKRLQRHLRVSTLEGGERCLKYCLTGKQWNLVPNDTLIEPLGITAQTQKPLVVIHGEEFGNFVIQIKSVSRNPITQPRALYSCHPMDIRSGGVDKGKEVIVTESEVCQVIPSKEVQKRLNEQVRNGANEKKRQMNKKK
ncbi:hypothetical protein Moror_9403 [Moniliophthora roreri MCA 2997]|uniref:Uncharacterized protein n=1 Tax=Moniliophthora roreri (strain MCA 2997) TaxID=1381753 RepID=V2X0P5_MONRO|nr:hypothetical protein Moror_9403 [Moniliophthora roreri MCA 2997]